MSFNGKHLSLEDRKVIEENINKGLRKFETAKELNKSQSTIGKEIKNNRKRRYSQTEDSPWKCKHYLLYFCNNKLFISQIYIVYIFTILLDLCKRQPTLDVNCLLSKHD